MDCLDFLLGQVHKNESITHLHRILCCFGVYLAREFCLRRAKFALIVNLLTRLSDIQLTLSAELLKLFPQADDYENAGHTIWSDRSNANWIDLVILSSIDKRFDFDLVERVALLLRPCGSIHLYRRANEYAAGLKDLLERQSNIVYHGQYSMADVDNIHERFAVGLTPYVLGSPRTQYINPDKYYLYLNAGMEVISTRIPQAMRMEDRIHVAESATCVVSIMRALQASQRLRKNTTPREETTWRFKALELIGLIQEKSSARSD